MNIFDPHISGSLSVSGSGEISGDLTVLGTINATISGTTSNAISASHAANYTLTSSFGSFTSSYTTGSFTGSFIGDGSGLTNIPASGVTGLNLTQIADGSVTASVSDTNGLRVNSKSEITGSLIVTNGITGSIDYSNITNKPTLVSGSSQVDITSTIGYSTFSSSISSSIGSLSSSVATTTNDLDGRLDSVETSTGSLNSFTSSINTTIKDKLNTEGVISGSSQVTIGDTTGFSTFSSSIATTDLNQNNRLGSLEGVSGSYATTGSNLFIGTQTHSGSILPSVDNAYDLGSEQYQWRDVYISSGSLYIDGTKVISSTAQELQITTDNGQSIKILEGGTDSIILQTADGDIELKSNADGDILLDPTNGKILLKGTVEVLSGQKIQSSVGGTPVVFANDIVVSGSIDITGTIEGINLTDFSSSVNSRLGSVEGGVTSLNSFTSSASGRLNLIETSTGSLNDFTNSINTTIKTKLNTENVISGSAQVNITGTTGYSTFSSSISASIGSIYDNFTSLSASFTDTDEDYGDRISVIESRYATTGSNVFIGNQTVTGSLYVSQNLIVQGESSLENITASAVSIGTNTIVLNSNTPAVRYAGISVFDSGSTNITASLLYDSLTNNWKFKHSDTGTNDASIFLYGPLSNDIDNAPTLVGNYLTKVENNGHGHHITTSSLFDNGSKVSINNNTEITGSLIVTSTIVSQGTPLVSGSSQITYSGLSNIPSGIISGSSQVVSSLPSGTVSGSSQVLGGTGIWSGSAQLPSGIISGAAQLPSGVVSGSSQVLLSSGVWSGSAQLPGGVVSGSSQIDLTATTNYSSGIKTRLNAEGVISGSSQVLAGTTIHSGSFFNGISVVSGSSQISLASTTGFGTYLNQAVLTSSSPTFAALTLGTEFTSNDSNGYSRFTESNGSAQVGLFRSGTSSGGVYIGGDSDFFRIYTANFGSILMSVSQSTGAISGSSFTGAGTGLTGTATSLSIGGNAATVTNGVYTTGNQTIGGTKTFSSTTVISVAGFAGIEYYNATTQWQGYIGTESNTGNLRYNSFNGTHTWYSNGTQTMQLGTSGTLSLVNNLGIGSSSSINQSIRLGGDNAAGGRLFFQYDGDSSYIDSYGGHGGTQRYRDLQIVARNINLTSSGGNVNVNGTQIVTNSGTWGISISGNAATATALTSMNISQFTNNSAYITGISFANVSSKPSTLSGYGISDGVKTNGTLTGNIDSDWGESFTTFDPIPSGTPPLQSPNIRTVNIGNNFSRRTQLAFDYASDVAYFRRRHDSAWGSWREFIHSGNISSQSVSYASTAGNISAYTINQNLGTSSSVKFGAFVDINSSASAFRFYDGSAFRGGLGLDDWAHGGSAANVTVYATGVLHFTSGATKRAYFNTSGHFLPEANASYDLGASGSRWRTIYTSDLSLSNGIGDYTIVEGEEKLYLYNNKNNKVYSFVLQEEDPNTATPKLPQ